MEITSMKAGHSNEDALYFLRGVLSADVDARLARERLAAQ